MTLHGVLLFFRERVLNSNYFLDYYVAVTKRTPYPNLSCTHHRCDSISKEEKVHKPKLHSKDNIFISREWGRGGGAVLEPHFRIQTKAIQANMRYKLDRRQSYIS